MKFTNGQYWWMPTNPDFWSLEDAEIGKEFPCSKYGNEGRPRPNPGAFDNIAKGDWILGCVCGRGNRRGVYSLLQCTHALTSDKFKGEDYGEHYRFKKVCDFMQCIPWEVFARNRVLKNAHMVKMSNTGSLFGFTKQEHDALLKLLREYRGRKFWTYTPGSTARKNWDFDADLNDGVMGLGQDALGDLCKYGKSVKRLASEMKRHYGVAGDGSGNARYMLDFVYEMQPGDVVFVKKGKLRFAGVGIVTGEYKFDRKRERHKQTRAVKWIKEFDKKSPVTFSITTLTELKDLKKVKQLLKAAGMSEYDIEREDRHRESVTVRRAAPVRKARPAPRKLSAREAAAKLKRIDRTERLRETLQREGQKELRNLLLSRRGKCEITGLKVEKLLVASHIRDWKKCSKEDKLNPDNVLLLSKNYDAAFDRKLISFDSSGKIVKSDSISWKELALLGIRKTARISRPKGKRVEFLAWHRAHLE